MQRIIFERATKGRYRGRVGDETALSISYFGFRHSIRHLHIVVALLCILFLSKTVMLNFTISANRTGHIHPLGSSKMINTLHSAENDLRIRKESKDLLLQLGLVVDSRIKALHLSGGHAPRVIIKFVRPFHETKNLEVRDVDTHGNGVGGIEEVVQVRKEGVFPGVEE